MKYIKTFESKDKPQIGDYVLCRYAGMKRTDNEEYFDFITNTIGQIVKIDDEDEVQPLYYVHYENVPDKLKSHWNGYYVLDKEPFRKKNITDWAKTKEDLELKIKSEIYNI